MQSVASRQEQVMLDSRAYITGSPLPTTPNDLSGRYTVAVTVDNNATPPKFLIKATPKGSQADTDSKCGVLSLDQVGTRTASGSAGVTGCW